MLEIRGIWLCHMSRWDRYVLRPRIWMETSRSGTVPHIGPYTLLVVTTMAGPFAFGEAEVLTFTQRGGESLKDAWYRINDSQKRATKKQSTTILLRNFDVGITSWN